MSNFKKYMVVPYVNKIEKPTESFIENADKSMSDIIKNPEIADDLKMKLYHQNLNKFLLKYDPETYGVTPTLAKLAQNVTEFLERKNDFNPIKIIEEKILIPKIEVKEELADLDVDYSSEPSIDNYEAEKEKKVLTNKSPINNNVSVASVKTDLNKGENIENSENFLESYERDINPAASTRSKKFATHSHGPHGDKSPIKIKAPIKQTTSEIKKPENLTRKVASQSGNGILSEWKTKKFL
jgi:hypothetical protein